jgi:hypothetical protein
VNIDEHDHAKQGLYIEAEMPEEHVAHRKHQNQKCNFGSQDKSSN